MELLRELPSSLKPPPPPAQGALAARLRRELLPRANHFLSLCNVGAPEAVSPRHTPGNVQPSFSEHKKRVFGLVPVPGAGRFTGYYSSFEAEFYTISDDRFWGAGNKRFAGDITVESDPVKLGALTYCRCTDAAYVFWEALSQLYADDAEIERVAWVYCRVQPRIVFVREAAMYNETRYLHDILIIHTSSGAKFVFDPTGYQFGFGDYLHEWGQYKRECVDGNLWRECMPRGWIKAFNAETSAEYRLMQAARLEEIDKVKKQSSKVVSARARALVE
ncbi:hypothetical protein N0V83_010031 [Neocucurbitaria cava]|uniref:Uncharacterized protein n=1 Tax=Neocucurbitaria cava TaxID=798079 RepID=A0A9W8Y0L8_9PLEO|nr:hypothetical protein N0V83_010031 [Neocucurbitaria cava]